MNTQVETVVCFAESTTSELVTPMPVAKIKTVKGVAMRCDFETADSETGSSESGSSELVNPELVHLSAQSGYMEMEILPRASLKAELMTSTTSGPLEIVKLSIISLKMKISRLFCAVISVFVFFLVL